MRTLTHKQFEALSDLILTGILAFFAVITVINLTVYGLHYLINLKF